MKSISLLSVLASLVTVSAAQAAPTLNTLDLTKKFEDGHYNLAIDSTYASGVIVLVPAPADANDLFMVSLQQDLGAQCAASGVASRKNADNTLTYYVAVHVINIQPNDGHCFIGIHIRSKDAVKQAFIDLFSQPSPPPQPQNQ